MNPSRRRALLAVVLLATLVALLVPVTQYLGNLQEFTVAPGTLARVLLVPALLIVALAALVLRFLPERALPACTSAMSALVLLAWTQAFLINWEYGLFDGRSIDWTASTWRGWIDLPLWILGLAAATAFHRKLERPLLTAACIVVALQSGALAAQGWAHREALMIKARAAHLTNSDVLAEFSPDRNVLHLVLDSFQADIFAEIVDDPKNAVLASELEGFTFFGNHLGVFPATYLAMPALLSGVPYLNDVPKAEYMDAAYGRASVLDAAAAAGYEVDVASLPWLLELLMRGPRSHAVVTSRQPYVIGAARALDLGLFRIVPHWLKPAVQNDQRWLASGLLSGRSNSMYPYFADNALLMQMARNLRLERARPAYKFIHVMTTHAPFVAAEDCTFAGGVVPRERANVLAQSRCSLNPVVALLQALKRAGIYDRATIVLMGDHGGHLEPAAYRAVEEHGRRHELRPDFLGLATPLLAIKPPGVRGPIRRSDAPTSGFDVAATVAGLAGLGSGFPGRNMFENRAGEEPRRPYFDYLWSRRDQTEPYIQRISAYTVQGPIYDPRSWQVGEVHVPPEAP